jgi:hypothetical protein
MSARGKPLLRWRRPAVQAELPLPDPTEPGEPAEPVPLRLWQQPAAVAALAALAAIALVFAITAQIGARRERERRIELESEVKVLTLRAPTRERSLRVVPNARSWSATPDAQLAWPEPPEMVELFIPVGYARFQVFAVTIDKADQGRMLVLQRVSPDSNRDLRISLNSTAFGPGEYRLRLQGYTWRGQRIDVGWVRLIIREGRRSAGA